jgi:hypothetical protein
MVTFTCSLIELKGEYDFGTSHSEYKGDLFIGNVGKVRSDCSVVAIKTISVYGVLKIIALPPEVQCTNYVSSRARGFTAGHVRRPPVCADTDLLSDTNYLQADDLFQLNCLRLVVEAEAQSNDQHPQV